MTKTNRIKSKAYGRYGHMLKNNGSLIRFTNTICPICEEDLADIPHHKRRPPSGLPGNHSRYKASIWHTDCLLSLGKWNRY